MAARKQMQDCINEKREEETGSDRDRSREKRNKKKVVVY